MNVPKRNLVMENLKDYIRVYEGALDDNLCRNIIKQFEDSTAHHERWERETSPQFTQLNVTALAEGGHDGNWGIIHNQLITAIQQVSDLYGRDLNCTQFWPTKNALEQIRLKKYSHETEDRFDTHIDVGDHDSSRRFLVLFFYLNDVEEGGETEFPMLDYRVKPKRGSVLLFPPTWMYPHAGLKPISNDKYIIGTYLHYQ